MVNTKGGNFIIYSTYLPPNENKIIDYKNYYKD